jgi:hypothetical protein
VWVFEVALGFAAAVYFAVVGVRYRRREAQSAG